MKTICSLIIIISLISFEAISQSDQPNNTNQRWEQNTFFKPGKTSHGGYGAVMVRYGQFKDDGVAIVGGKGAWIINHSLGIGLAGSGIIARPVYSSNNFHTGYTGGYGGFLIEPIFFSQKVVHFSVPLLIGGGGIGQYTWYKDQFVTNNKYVSFGVFEPGVEVDFNMVSWFRISVGAYYAFKTKISGNSNLDPEMLAPLSFGINFKFGSF